VGYEINSKFANLSQVRLTDVEIYYYCENIITGDNVILVDSREEDKYFEPQNAYY